MRDGRVFGLILAKYKRAWEKRDPRLATELFTPDATYREDPFDRRPMRGLGEIRDYWAKVPRFQKNIRFTHGPVFHLGQSRVWGAESSYRFVFPESFFRPRGQFVFAQVSHASSCPLKEIPRTKHLTQYQIEHIQRVGE